MPSPFASLGLDPGRTGRCVLTHPVTREPLVDADGQEAFILLRSVSSPEAESHRLNVQERARKLGRDFDASEIQENYNVLLSRLTLDWHLLGLDGTPIEVPCSFAMARELYADLSLRWVKDQVGEFLGREGNFQPAGSLRSELGSGTSLNSA